MEAPIPGTGAVLFDSPLSPLALMDGLRLADDILAHVASWPGLLPAEGADRKASPSAAAAAEALQPLREAPIDWGPAVHVHAVWASDSRASPSESAPATSSSQSTAIAASTLSTSASLRLPPEPRPQSNLAFRVTCTRTSRGPSKHLFTSTAAAGALGARIVNCSGLGWRTDLERFDVEVVLRIVGAHTSVGLSLMYTHTKHSAERSKGAHLYNRRDYRSVGVLTSLRPSIAAFLCALAGPFRTGDVFVDPAGGSGTLPLEADLTFGPGVFAITGDACPEAAAAAAANSAAARKEGRWGADVILWDARRLPLRRGVVDRIASDLPFGNKCRSVGNKSSLFALAPREVGRVLRPGTGRAVLLGLGTPLRTELTAQCGGGDGRDSDVDPSEAAFPRLLRLTASFEIDMGGLHPFAYVLERTEAEAPLTAAARADQRGRGRRGGSGTSNSKKTRLTEAAVGPA